MYRAFGMSVWGELCPLHHALFCGYLNVEKSPVYDDWLKRIILVLLSSADN